MITSASIREDVRKSGKSIKKRHAELIASFQSGIANGLADHINVSLSIANKEYFVDTYRVEKKAADFRKDGSLKYTEFRGANKPDKRGKLKFVKGKIVNRSGLMNKAISPLSWVVKGVSDFYGKNTSPDSLGFIEKKSDSFFAEIKITGRTGRLMGIHINKNRIRILEGAFGKSKRNFKKLIDAGVFKKLEPLKVLR